MSTQGAACFAGVVGRSARTDADGDGFDVVVFTAGAALFVAEVAGCVGVGVGFRVDATVCCVV